MHKAQHINAALREHRGAVSMANKIRDLRGFQCGEKRGTLRNSFFRPFGAVVFEATLYITEVGGP
jgi:hypothetical protein